MTPSAVDRPVAVQIGFNKCATLSLTRLFNRSGVRSLHCNWSRGKGRNATPPYQVRIHRNIVAQRPAFDGLDRFSGFFDLEHIRQQNHFENFKHFKVICETYPNARFILNVRDKAKWLRSRARHTGGVYLAKYMKIYNASEEEVFARWAQDFEAHHAAVRAYFADKPDRLVEFEISSEPISKIVTFFQPDFNLNPEHWGHAHKTNEKAWAETEKDRWADYDFSRFGA
jgi:hypothetical protein